jgi:hypothetical protein
MTQEEIDRMNTSLNTFVAGVRAMQATIDEQTNEIGELRTRLEEYNRRAEIMEAPQEIDMDSAIQPEYPATLPTVRFLSRTAGMGGLANIRAAMQDIGVNVKRLRLEGSSYTPTEDVLIINWGGGFEIPDNVSSHSGRWLNKLDAVKIAASKLKTFDKLYENTELREWLPNYATSASSAANANWEVTYCRETLYGHSGDGIRVINRGDALPEVPLYVEGLAVRHEYRVHAVNGYTKLQKKASLENENPNLEVRNISGGWTFINDFTLGDGSRATLHRIANKVLEQLGLDFGAVDVVRTEEGEWKVLEVNTAPGVTSPSNIEWYTKALLKD